jgi:GTP-binding protein
MIDEQWYLVDLPGYGYARISREKRSAWEKLIRNYLLQRTNLMSAFLLVDARLTMQEIDREVINWFGENQVHFQLVFTKSDKISANQLASNIAAYKSELLKDWESLPPLVITSSKTGIGRDEILRFIKDTNKLFRQ